MNKHLLFGTMALLVGSLLQANAAPKDDLTAAAKKLADKDNYSWKQKTENAGGGGFGGGAGEGKLEKDGYLWVSMTGNLRKKGQSRSSCSAVAVVATGPRSVEPRVR